MVDIGKLRELAMAATPGPWIRNYGTKSPTVRAETAESKIAKWVRICVSNCSRDGDHPQAGRAEANSNFIAAANPKTILMLLDELDALRHEVDQYHSMRKPIIHPDDETSIKHAAANHSPSRH